MILLTILKGKLKKQTGLPDIDKSIFDIDVMNNNVAVSVIYKENVLNSSVDLNENKELLNFIDLKIKNQTGFKNANTHKILFTVDYKTKSCFFEHYFELNGKKSFVKGDLKSF